MKKKSATTLVIVLVVILAIVLWVIKVYNSMVTKNEAVTTAWSQVENVYQRRSDLIPNLVSTVKGYAAHETNTLQAVVDARAQATQTKIDPSNLTPEEVAKFQEAQNQVGSSLSRLLMTVENYPDLKANENFLALQTQLESTENRIAVERMKYNETARDYNTYIRKFPANIFAGMFNFTTKGYFEAQEGADVAPTVSFE